MNNQPLSALLCLVCQRPCTQCTMPDEYGNSYYFCCEEHYILYFSEEQSSEDSDEDTHHKKKKHHKETKKPKTTSEDESSDEKKETKKEPHEKDSEKNAKPENTSNSEGKKPDEPKDNKTATKGAEQKNEGASQNSAPQIPDATGAPIGGKILGGTTIKYADNQMQGWKSPTSKDFKIDPYQFSAPQIKPAMNKIWGGIFDGNEMAFGEPAGALKKAFKKKKDQDGNKLTVYTQHRLPIKAISEGTLKEGKRVYVLALSKDNSFKRTRGVYVKIHSKVITFDDDENDKHSNFDLSEDSIKLEKGKGQIVHLKFVSDSASAKVKFLYIVVKEQSKKKT